MEATPRDSSPLAPGEARELFDVPEDVAYFNAASLAPQLRSVRAAGEAALARLAKPWTIARRDWFAESDRLRGLFGELIGSDSEGVALVPASSYGLAVAAANLEAGPGERVLVLDEEYASGIYTWRAFARRTGAELLTVSREPGQRWAEAVLAALDERVRIVSVPNVHWTNGSLVELEPIAERAHQLGAALVLDLSQSAGVMPIDVKRLRPDFLVAVGYKWLLGPFALGYLYVDERHRGGEPIEHNWILRAGAEDFARIVEYTDELQPGARRFDVGERTNFTLTPMAIAALEQVGAWTPERIGRTLATVTAAIEDGVRERGLIAIPAAERGPHIVGIEFTDAVPEAFTAALAERNVHVGVRSNWLRISPHLHAIDADVERLFAALDAALDA